MVQTLLALHPINYCWQVWA